MPHLQKLWGIKVRIEGIMQTSYIYLNDLRFNACHGVLEQERVVGNDYLVSLRVEYPFTQAMQIDRVEDTLSYADIFEAVKAEMNIPSALLEHVAYRIAQAVLGLDMAVRSVHIRLTKINPPMGADCGGAGVELHLINDKTI